MSQVHHREHVGPLFAGIVALVAIVATLLGTDSRSMWLASFVVVANIGKTLVAVAVTTSWRGTRKSPLSDAAALITVGAVILLVLAEATNILWAPDMDRSTVRLIFQGLQALVFAGLGLAFVSMALDTRLLAQDSGRFVAFAGVAGALLMAAAPFMDLQGLTYTYIFYGCCAVGSLGFAWRAQQAAKNLPVPPPEMSGWSTALAGAELFKTALTWLILSGVLINMVTRNIKDADTLMMILVGVLFLKAALLATAARGAAKFRAIPALTEAQGPAFASAAFALIAATYASMLLIMAGLGVVGMERLSATEVFQYLVPSLEAGQSVMWITAVLSLMAALSALGRTMNAASLKRAARLGLGLFGLGALATLTVQGAGLGNMNGREGAGTLAIVGLVSLVVLIAGLVYVFKALQEADEHLAGAEGEMVASALE